MVKCTDFRLNQANFGIKWANFDLLPTKLQTSQASLNDITVDLDGNWASSLNFSCTLMFLHVLQIKIRLLKVFLKVLKNTSEFFTSKNFFRKEFCEKH